MKAHTLAEKEADFLHECAAAARDISASDIEDLRSAIAKAAYYRAEKRSFEPGHEMIDWLEAEQEILSVQAEVRDRPATA